jgi:hypothetical protein
MKRKYNLRKLKSKRSYSNLELANALEVHVQTVRGWRKNGLKPIDSSAHHPLYLGSIVQVFLSEKRKMKKIKLKQHEFYCLSCRDRTTSIETTFVFQEMLIGKNLKSFRKVGLCVKCGRKVNKFDIGETKDLDTTKVINKGSSASL